MSCTTTSSMSSSSSIESKLTKMENSTKRSISLSSSLQLSPLEHTLASQTASALSTLIVYPMDVVRMRYMAQDGTLYRVHNGQFYRNVWRSFKLIYYNEGGTRAFFRGCHVSIGGAICAWGVYMYTYRSLCDWHQKWLVAKNANSDNSIIMNITSKRNDKHSINVTKYNTNDKKYSYINTHALYNLFQRFGLSTLASATSAIICNPIWLMKTRMQLEEVSAHTQCTERHYKSFCTGAMHVIRTQGVPGLWRGTSAQVILGLPNAFNLPLYETLKSVIMCVTGESSLSVHEICLCQTITKVTIAVLCHPLLLVKTLMQDQRARVGEVQYYSFTQTLLTTYRRRGIVGLYRGLLPSLYQTVPRSVFMYVLYEQALKVAAYYH